MKKLISFLLFGILSTTGWAGVSKKECIKACETCISCGPVSCPSVPPTPTPPPPAGLDLKLVSISPTSGALQVLPLLPGQAGTQRTIFGSPKWTMNSNKAVSIRAESKIAKVDPVTHQLLSGELKSGVGFQSIPAAVDTANNIALSIPAYYGFESTYRIQICVYAVDLSVATRPDLPESTLANNCLSGEYTIKE